MDLVKESNGFVECFTLSDLVSSGGFKLSSALGSSGATVSFGLKLVACHERDSFDSFNIQGMGAEHNPHCASFRFGS